MSAPSRRRIAVRLVGAGLLTAALTIRLLTGVPVLPGDATLGSGPGSAAHPADTAGRTSTEEAIAASPASPPAASPVPPTAAADDERATGATPDTTAPRFTSTAPRSAIDQGRWPARVVIPRLDVVAPVAPVGVGSQGALVVPDSPADVGWYHGGSLPGEAGVALLTSHVDTRREGRGVFAGLVRLEVGDRVEIVSADGAEQQWTVTARTQHAKDALPDHLFDRSGDPTLALVTCGGPFDPSSRSYRDNVIVWASPTASPTG